MRSFVLHSVKPQEVHRAIENRPLGPRVASAAREMTTRRILAAAFLSLAIGAAGCHKSEAAQAAPGGDAPAGQAWLTREQVAEAHIVVAPLAEQDVDDTILSSGRVTFDDQRVAHVFSPVTGRVATILANLGERLHRGQPLAVITSPDIGQASSDLGKADADLIAAEHDFKRKKELFEAHAASQADYETSEDNYRKAKAEKERAYQKAFLLRTGSVDSVTQGYTLTSPIEGELIARAVNPGIEVQG